MAPHFATQVGVFDVVIYEGPAYEVTACSLECSDDDEFRDVQKIVGAIPGQPRLDRAPMPRPALARAALGFPHRGARRRAAVKSLVEEAFGVIVAP